MQRGGNSNNPEVFSRSPQDSEGAKIPLRPSAYCAASIPSRTPLSLPFSLTRSLSLSLSRSLPPALSSSRAGFSSLSRALYTLGCIVVYSHTDSPLASPGASVDARKCVHTG